MKSISEYINEALKLDVTPLLAKGRWHQWCNDVYDGDYKYEDTVTQKDGDETREYTTKIDTWLIAKSDGPEQAAADLLVSLDDSAWTGKHSNKIELPDKKRFDNLIEWFIQSDDKKFAEECAANYLAGLLDYVKESDLVKFKSSLQKLIKKYPSLREYGL